MLQCLVCLKQKDLNAVSAAKILSDHPIVWNNQRVSLKGLDYLQLVSIDVDSTFFQALRTGIDASYVFSNPNKQVLTHVSNAMQMVDSAVYAHVFRRKPVNLSRYCRQLNAMMSKSVVRAVFVSDIWQMTLDSTCDVSVIESQWVTSGSGACGLFAHPLIHNVHVFYGVNFFSNINDSVNSCNY